MSEFRVKGRIWLERTDGERFMGIGRMELLQHIQRTGSINQAAKAMNMSYKRAWDLIQSVNQLAGRALVTTQTGGQKGGGASLTPEGIAYLTYYQDLQTRLNTFLANENEYLRTFEMGQTIENKENA